MKTENKKPMCVQVVDAMVAKGELTSGGEKVACLAVGALMELGFMLLFGPEVNKGNKGKDESRD